VGMEPVLGACSSGRIRTGAGQIQIRLTNNTIEIEDRGRVAAGLLRRRFGICGCRRSIDRAWKEKSEAADADDRQVEMGNRICLRARASGRSLVIVIVAFAMGGSPQARA